MKKAQTILEYTIITAFLLVSALLITQAIRPEGIERKATFGVIEDGKVVVPPMTP